MKIKELIYLCGVNKCSHTHTCEKTVKKISFFLIFPRHHCEIAESRVLNADILCQCGRLLLPILLFAEIQYNMNVSMYFLMVMKENFSENGPHYAFIRTCVGIGELMLRFAHPHVRIRLTALIHPIHRMAYSCILSSAGYTEQWMPWRDADYSHDRVYILLWLQNICSSDAAVSIYKCDCVMPPFSMMITNVCVCVSLWMQDTALLLEHSFIHLHQVVFSHFLVGGWDALCIQMILLHWGWIKSSRFNITIYT